MAVTADLHIAALDLEVVAGQPRSVRLLDAATIPGTWAAVAGRSYAVSGDVTVDGDDVVIAFPATDGMVGWPWRLRLDGVDKVGGIVRNAKPQTVPGDAAVTVSVLDEAGVTVEVAVASQGPPGASAYEVAVANGFVGTEAEWLASLQGGSEGGGGGEIPDGSVTSAKIANGTIVDVDVNASAAIAESKLNLASDAAAGTPSRRTLGTGATQAAAGDDTRLSDQRVPIVHAASHGDGGTDELALDASQVTTGVFADERIPATVARDTEVAATVESHRVDTTDVHGITDTTALATQTYVDTATSSAVNDGDPAGGVLSGTYPNPGFATDMATQAELDAAIATRAPLRITIPADKTASHTAIAADANASTGMSAAGALTVTINTGVFVAGDLAEYRQVGAGQVTIVAGAGVTLRAPSGVKTRVQYSAVQVLALGGETFSVTGDTTT